MRPLSCFDHLHNMHNLNIDNNNYVYDYRDVSVLSKNTN